MTTANPNYDDLGFADQMGSQLRKLVETQLTADLKEYQVDSGNLKFDWSESCIEGHRTDFLDGSVENFSGIAVFDNTDNLIADGWMEFIREGDFFLAYWEFVSTWNEDTKLAEKKTVGIPDHVWVQIPDDMKSNWKRNRMKK